MNTIKDFACDGEINLRMCYPLPLPLDSKDPAFCSLITNTVAFYKISVRDDLQKLPMVLLTVNRNPCNPWAFQLMVKSVVCKNVKIATEI